MGLVPGAESPDCWPALGVEKSMVSSMRTADGGMPPMVPSASVSKCRPRKKRCCMADGNTFCTVKGEKIRKRLLELLESRPNGLLSFRSIGNDGVIRVLCKNQKLLHVIQSFPDDFQIKREPPERYFAVLSSNEKQHCNEEPATQGEPNRGDTSDHNTPNVRIFYNLRRLQRWGMQESNRTSVSPAAPVQIHLRGRKTKGGDTTAEPQIEVVTFRNYSDVESWIQKHTKENEKNKQDEEKNRKNTETSHTFNEGKTHDINGLPPGIQCLLRSMETGTRNTAESPTSRTRTWCPLRGAQVEVEEPPVCIQHPAICMQQPAVCGSSSASFSDPLRMAQEQGLTWDPHPMRVARGESAWPNNLLPMRSLYTNGLRHTLSQSLRPHCSMSAPFPPDHSYIADSRVLPPVLSSVSPSVIYELGCNVLAWLNSNNGIGSDGNLRYSPMAPSVSTLQHRPIPLASPPVAPSFSPVMPKSPPWPTTPPVVLPAPTTSLGPPFPTSRRPPYSASSSAAPKKPSQLSG